MERTTRRTRGLVAESLQSHRTSRSAHTPAERIILFPVPAAFVYDPQQWELESRVQHLSACVGDRFRIEGFSDRNALYRAVLKEDESHPAVALVDLARYDLDN